MTRPGQDGPTTDTIGGGQSFWPRLFTLGRHPLVQAPKSYLNLDVGLERERLPGYEVPPVAGQGGWPVP